MKRYETPALSVELFETSDVITASRKLNFLTIIFNGGGDATTVDTDSLPYDEGNA